MKPSIMVAITFLGILFYFKAYSQSTEYEFSAGSGLFHYNYFPSPVNSSYSLVFYDNYQPAGPPSLYTTIPRGNKPGFSWHLFTGKKHINRHNIIFEWGLYYETRESKKEVTNIINFNPTTAMLDVLPGSGEIRLTNHLIGISAFIGKRWSLSPKTYIDALFGIEDMISTSNKAHLVLDANTSSIYAPPNGLSLHKDNTSADSGVDGSDLRINGKMEIGYKNWGVNIGYAIGIESAPNSLYDPPTNFDIKKSNTSRYLYSSLFYRIKKHPKMKKNKKFEVIKSIK